jgi:hypothetical protein
MRANQLTGMKFGRLTVHGPTRSAKNAILWECECVCGKKTKVHGTYLKNGRVVSCGCYAADKNRERATHGMSKTSTYVIWKTMRARCGNTYSPGYAGYGARGITVCPEWDSSFEKFLADMGPRPEGMSIERIDNTRGYEPGNCKWATNGEQCRNRRSTHLITHQGRTQCRADWAKELGIPPAMLKRRIEKLGVDKAFESFNKEKK